MFLSAPWLLLLPFPWTQTYLHEQYDIILKGISTWCCTCWKTSHTNQLKDCHYSFSVFQILFCFKYSSPNHKIHMQQKSKFFVSCWLPSTWPSRRRRNCQGENVWSSSHASIHPGTSSFRAHLGGWNMVRMIEFQGGWNLTVLADPLLASTISRLVIFWTLQGSCHV